MTESKTRSTARSSLCPVDALKKQVTALDAAMLVAVTAAEVGAVHKLRTSTRRVEAMLVMIDLLGTGAKAIRWPEHRAEANAVRRRLRKVRRAAGTVRDLDVQRDAIWYDAPAKSAVHKDSPGDAMRKEAKRLRKHLEGRRDTEAAKLIRILQAEEQKLAASLHTLEHVLKPGAHHALAQAVLMERVEHWFANETHALLHPKGSASSKGVVRSTIDRIDAEDLHAVRKAAKLCRYMAEIAPENTPAQKLAERFEAMQEAGGKWHDWLLLEELARGYLGKRSPLAARYAKHRDAALSEYHLRLAEVLPTVTPPPAGN